MLRFAFSDVGISVDTANVFKFFSFFEELSLPSPLSLSVVSLTAPGQVLATSTQTESATTSSRRCQGIL